MRLLIDGHLDLAMNALIYERDQTLELSAVRGRELPAPGIWHKGGTATVTLPEMRRAGVAICSASIITRVRPNTDPAKPISRENLDWPSPDMAYAVAQGQLAYYRLLESRGEVRLITDRAALDAHWQQWEQNQGPRAKGYEVETLIANRQSPIAGLESPVSSLQSPAPSIGLILMLEGADPIVEPAQLAHWHAQGLRIIALGHYGPGRYAMGTAAADAAGLTPLGRELLAEMAKLGMALDLTHLSDASFAEAVDRYEGPLCATHSNCRVLADNTRQLTDAQLRRIIEREGVIGAVCHNAMIQWVDGKEPPRAEVSLEHLVQHIDHVCQLAGDARHVALGSDLDGGFGTEHMPREIDSIADLHKLQPLLSARGYSDADIAAIFHGNWLSFWRRVLPPSGR